MCLGMHVAVPKCPNCLVEVDTEPLGRVRVPIYPNVKEFSEAMRGEPTDSVLNAAVFQCPKCGCLALSGGIVLKAK